MDKFLLTILLCSVICFARAQDTLSDRNSLKAGAWAMQFGIASNFTLTSFQGTSLSLKYHLSDRNAIRGGITINGSTSDGNSTSSQIVADTSIGSSPGSNASDAATVTFVLQYLWYASPAGPVHVYVALGPSIAYNYSHNASDYSNARVGEYYDTAYHYYGYSEKVLSRSNSHQWGIGLVGAVGLEWFATHWLSIRAEYGEGIQYLWRSSASSNSDSFNYPANLPPNYFRSPSTGSDNSTTTKGWSASTSGVSFGLSVYW